MDPLEPIDYPSIDLISPAAAPKKRLATAPRMADLAAGRRPPAARAALHPISTTHARSERRCGR